MAAVQGKRLLPPYDVFFEPRWFVPAAESRVVDLGRRLGLLVCEDLWDAGYTQHPSRELRAAGAELLVAISASPFRLGVREQRLHHALRAGLPVVYLNRVGADDELVFDGASFVVNGGEVVARLPRFEEAVEIVEVDGAPVDALPVAEERDVFDAIVLGIRDFAAKNGLRTAWLGLSGGIDSALVACLAAEALGPTRVVGAALPSRFTDPRSTVEARVLAERLGIGFELRELEPLHEAARAVLAADLAGEVGTTAENLQARLRMVLLMALVNRHGGFLLNTSNKTELAVGYSTVYGDQAGVLAPIADLSKDRVYRLARWLNAERGVIPDFVLDRPPTAELKPDQVDPFDYTAAGPELEAVVLGAADDAVRQRWDDRVRRAEHKRWQHGIVLKVTERAFGTGRMVPVTRR